jgi:protein transport protein SEC24
MLGIRAVDFYGNFYMSNTTDVEMACVGSDTSLSVEIKHDDKLSEADGAYIQAAVLYTSVGGRRRLRVLNTAFNTCIANCRHVPFMRARHLYKLHSETW